MAGWAVAGRNFDLSDDSACASGADNEGRFSLIPFAVVTDALQQRTTDTAEATLCVADGSAGAPSDCKRRDGIAETAMKRHRSTATATRTDNEFCGFECVPKRRQTVGVVLPIRIHRKHAVDAWRERERMRETGHKRRTFSAICGVPQHVISAAQHRRVKRVVSRAIVNHHDDDVGTRSAHTVHHSSDRIRCLIGRDHARRATHQTAAPAAEVSSRRISRNSVSMPTHVATSSAWRALGFSSPALRNSSRRRLAPSIVYFSV